MVFYTFQTLGEKMQMEQLRGMLLMLKEFWAVLVMVRKQYTTLVKKMHMEQMQRLFPLHRWCAALARQRKQQTIFIKRRSVGLNKVYPVTCVFVYEPSV